VLLASEERRLDFSEDAELALGGGSSCASTGNTSSELTTCRKGDCCNLLDEAAAAILMLSVISLRNEAVLVSDAPCEGDCLLCGEDAIDESFPDLKSAGNTIQRTNSDLP